MNDNNYPDDIRKYDHDPRSPFHDDGSDAKEMFMTDRVGVLMQDPDFVNEALGELNKETLGVIGRGAEKSMWVASPHDSEIWEHIGRGIQVHLYDYATKQAENEWELLIEQTGDDEQ